MRWFWPGRGMQRRAVAGPSGLSRGVRARQPGQTLAEAAITAMISIMTVLATLQISLVIAQAFSAMYVAQTTARWLAVRIDTTDTVATNQAITFASGLPGLGNGGLTTAGVTITPACASLDGSGKCASRDSGDAITVAITTSLTPVMFLPTTFGGGNFVFRLPTTMPTIRYTVLLE